VALLNVKHNSSNSFSNFSAVFKRKPFQSFRPQAQRVRRRTLFQEFLRANRFQQSLKTKLLPLFLRLFFRQSRNNFFSTLVDNGGRVIWTLSVGVIGLQGPRRSTPFGAEQLGRSTAKRFLKFNLRKPFLAVILKSPFNRHMKSSLRNFLFPARSGFFLDLLPRPHNGLRTRKMRRL
jgi:ribosomal protein S11